MLSFVGPTSSLIGGTEYFVAASSRMSATTDSRKLGVATVTRYNPLSILEN
jgi:hypothetical protein